MFHEHGVHDSDLHFIIDPITRDIYSESGKVILMQRDHDSERFTFELPRLIEEHDMTLCNVVEVHYVNKGGTNNRFESRDVYPVLDLQISPVDNETAVCSWLVSRNATTYVGKLEFNLRFACVDTSTGEASYEWFTNQYTDIKIEESIYNTEIVVQEYSPDALAVWKQEVHDMAADLVDEAEIHAANAKNSENNARVSETNSASYMQAAAESEKNAKQSELNAATSEAAVLEAAEKVEAYEAAANDAAEAAIEYGFMSKSYAVGATGERLGEDTDNSKYYSEVAQNLYNESLTTLRKCEESLVDLNERAIGVVFSLNFETGNLEYTSPVYLFSINTDTGNLEWSVEAPNPEPIAAMTATSSEIEAMLDEVL